MDKTNTLLLCATAALMSMLLTACGGGSDTNAEAAPAAIGSVPDEASASTAGMAKWITSLSAASPDAQEPLDPTRFNPPSTDDSEPELVN